MKTHRWIARCATLVLLAALSASVVPAQEIKKGDTAEDVTRQLGKPQGRITSGTYEVYLYDRGKVELQKGIVSEVSLISAEEAVARKLEQERRREVADRLAAEAKEKRHIEGGRILAERLANPAFSAQPAGQQVAYWDMFRQQYPEIDIGTVYANAMRQYQADLEQARIREQLADLQQRTTAAEARALRAERAAEEAYSARSTITYIASPWVPSYPNTYFHPPVPAYFPATPAVFPATTFNRPAPRNTTTVSIRKSDLQTCSTGMTFSVKSERIIRH
ncbi:MAG: hypothetical protein WCO42_01765 [bacterium]